MAQCRNGRHHQIRKPRRRLRPPWRRCSGRPGLGNYRITNYLSILRPESQRYDQARCTGLSGHRVGTLWRAILSMMPSFPTVMNTIEHLGPHCRKAWNDSLSRGACCGFHGFSSTGPMEKADQHDACDEVRKWRRSWPAKALWICRCAWTTPARRPQLHRANINQAF